MPGAWKITPPTSTQLAKSAKNGTAVVPMKFGELTNANGHNDRFGAGASRRFWPRLSSQNFIEYQSQENEDERNWECAD